MKPLCAFLILLLTTLSAHAGYTKCVVEGRAISNPTIGFYGISLQIPLGWFRFAPVQDVNHRTNNNAQRAWRMATDFDSGPGGRTHEIITLHNGTNGIAFAISSAVGDNWPSEKRDKKGYDWALADVARGFVFPAGREFVREVAQVGERRFAKIGRVVDIGGQPHVNLVYIVGLAPSYRLSLNGLCAEKDRESLERDMNDLIGTLATRK